MRSQAFNIRLAYLIPGVRLSLVPVFGTLPEVVSLAVCEQQMMIGYLTRRKV